LRRQQWFASALMEVGITTIGESNPAVHQRVPLPSGNEQMEQDRTPPIFLHQQELAWTALGEFGGDCQLDRGYAHQRGSHGSLRNRQRTLSQGAKDHGRADGDASYRTRQISWRVELYDSPATK